MFGAHEFPLFFVLQCANSTLTDEFSADENLLETSDVNQPEEIEPTCRGHQTSRKSNKGLGELNK